MDGVLIDAKDWHYEALNDALRLFGLEISRSDHLSTFDGLPTKRKLEILSQTRGLPRSLHGFINDIKQRRTYELTVERCRPMFHHQYALSGLKRDGLKIAVCSNSISATIATMMNSAALDQYLDFFISNQDVKNPKPHPEMYLTGINRCGIQPHETLIVEDNEHGIQAAKASGGHVLEVQTVFDVTYERIRAMIDKIEAAA
jgi:HAD superfamily hydrolase (TIGR01509 family)